MNTGPFVRLRILTRDWQRGMRPWRAGRRLALVAWTLLMLFQAWWWAFAWFSTDRLKQLEDAIESIWAPGRGPLPWWQEGDLPLHIGTMLLLTLTLELGRWLIRPVWGRWTAPALALAIGLADELAQSLSPNRQFEFRDLLNDLIGCVIAIGLMAAASRLIRRREPIDVW